MDPFQARVEIIAGRPYRVNDVDVSLEPKRPRMLLPDSRAAGVDQDEDEVVLEEQEPVPMLDDALIRKEGDTLVTTLSCDPPLFPVLIGAKGATKQMVETDTGAVLTFPKRDLATGQQASNVRVQAPDKAALSAAVHQLKKIVNTTLAKQGANSLDYNYFISIPLTLGPGSSEMLTRVHKFQEDAAAAYKGTTPPTLDSSIFNKAESMHLTVCMLKLYSDEARLKARQTLTGLRQKVVGEVLAGKALQVKLQGLDIMNENPAAANVVYAKCLDKSGRLQRLCDAVVTAFNEAELLLPQDNRPTKLHATLINTRYLKGPTRPEGRFSLDVRSVLKACAGLDLGQLTLPTVHLSQRSAFDPDTGYYNCAAALDLPTSL